MTKIHLLENSLINKIAAGEVIERPASVVKELIENSIDAGAKNITIEIKDGGISLIRVTDDGKGIEKDQLKLAFLRHATSKLNSFNDLENILTLGFRGEALSSIASVSQIEMITKTKDSETGSRIEIHGGEVINEQEVGAANGTSFIMRNLFYNTPARRKFLKKPASESGHISDIINKIALGNPDISIKYINNNSVLLQTSGKNDLKTSIFHVYGKEAVKKMIYIENEENGFKLFGYIGKPELSRGNRSYENFFINGRYIKSTIVQNASEEAYKGKLMVGKFPVYILNLEIPAGTVDVNVHPSKLEVRFSDENFIFNLVYDTIDKALKKENLIPETNFDKKEKVFNFNQNKEIYKAYKNQNSIDDLILEKEQIKNNLDEYTAKRIRNIISVEEVSSDTVDLPKNRFNADKLYDFKKDIIILDNTEIENKNNTDKLKSLFFNNYKIIGQIFGTYWIIEQKGSLYLIDQHAAHERILYEEITHKLKEQKTISQNLLQPIAVNLSESEKEVLKENRKLLEDFGFEIEEFGGNNFALRAVPCVFNGPVNSDFFIEIIDILQTKNLNNIYDTKSEAIAAISCKAAVKGNNRLSYIEAKEIIEKIVKLENPFTCPHGRPTIIEITKYEIEKKFKRIQNS